MRLNVSRLSSALTNASATSPTHTGWKRVFGTADRQHREKFRQRCKHVQEIVFGPEHDRWPENRPVEVGRLHDRIAVALAALIHRRAIRIGAHRAHVQQAADAVFVAHRDDAPRQLDVRLRKLAVRSVTPTSPAIRAGHRSD